MDEKECRTKLIQGITNEFLGNSYVSKSYIGKKIKDSHFNVVDLYTLYEIHKRSFEKVKSFTNHIGRVNYIFKALENEAELL